MICTVVQPAAERDDVQVVLSFDPILTRFAVLVVKVPLYGSYVISGDVELLHPRPVSAAQDESVKSHPRCLISAVLVLRFRTFSKFAVSQRLLTTSDQRNE